MSFLFVDRILDLQPRTITKGVKVVSAYDNYIITDRDGERIFLPSLIGETIGQLCAWNVMRSVDFRFRPVAGLTAEVNLLGRAKVGDVIQLETEIFSLENDSVHYSGSAYVNGKPIFIVKDSFGPMLPMHDFIDPERAKQQFHLINRPGDWNSPPATIRDAVNEVSPPTCIDGYDKIIKWQPDDEVIALKHINLAAPYFRDHFPNKAVYPLTLLMNAKMALARQVLDELLGVEGSSLLNKVTLTRMKMGRFVQPGDTIITTLFVKQCDKDKAVFQFRSEVEGNRVSVVKAEYYK